MDIRKQFAKNLRLFMDLKGVRQQDLIDNLGFSSATVSQWVNGKAFPRPSRIETLAKYLGITVDELYAGNNTEVLMQEVPLDTAHTNCILADLKESGVKRVILEF